MMQSSQDGDGNEDTRPLDWSMQRRILWIGVGANLRSASNMDHRYASYIPLSLLSFQTQCRGHGSAPKRVIRARRFTPASPRGLLHRRGTQATSPSITNFPAALAKVPPNNRLFQRVPGTDKLDAISLVERSFVPGLSHARRAV
jgi:hypothetical protein